MAAWWFCCRCGCSYAVNETIASGIGELEALCPSVTWDNEDDEPEAPCTVSDCNVALFSMSFSSTAVQEEFLGTDPPAFPWVLFKSGSTWSRAGGRPIPVEVDTSEISYVGPTETTKRFYVPTEIRLDSTFTWERGAASPVYDDGTHWGDFDELYLSAGASPPYSGMPDDGQSRCVRIEFHVTPVGFVWPEGDAPGIRVEFEADNDEGECCESFETDVCLTYSGEAVGPLDGWMFNGQWDGDKDVDCDDVTLNIAASLEFRGATEGNCTIATLTAAYQGTFSEVFEAECETDRDVLALPLYSAFIPNEEGSDFCNLTMSALDMADCSELDDCGDCYCVYGWDGDEWVLGGNNNCGLGGCPETPTNDDPPEEGGPYIRYECCECEDTGGCPEGFEQCPGPDSCGWIWDAGGSSWTSTGCAGSAEGCTCYGMPERVGAFDGETVEGFCCSAIP